MRTGTASPGRQRARPESSAGWRVVARWRSRRTTRVAEHPWIVLGVFSFDNVTEGGLWTHPRARLVRTSQGHALDLPTGGAHVTRLRLVLLSMAVAALLLVGTASAASAGIVFNAID